MKKEKNILKKNHNNICQWDVRNEIIAKWQTGDKYH